MDVQHKDAVITPTGQTDDFPGTFEVILSAPTKDRDGDTLLPDEWKQPLPDHITFDSDHGMTVGTTVGSGVPRIDEQSGNLVVAGTYSSLQRAQDVRTLVNEGHIRTTSVAFMTEKSPQKDGKHTVTRELLNGAFVAVPSNREALVLSSKSGARNSASDAERIQSIHDHAVALGAKSDAVPPDPKKPAPGKPISGKPGAAKSVVVRKDADSDPGKLAQAADAALDEALTLLNGIDASTLPEPVQQAIGLITAAEEAIDSLLESLGVSDPDDTEDDSTAAATNATAPAAKAAGAVAEEATAAEKVSQLIAGIKYANIRSMTGE